MNFKQGFLPHWLIAMGALTLIRIVGFMGAIGLLPAEAKNGLMIFPNSALYFLDPSTMKYPSVLFLSANILLANSTLAYLVARSSGYRMLAANLTLLIGGLAVIGFASTYFYLVP